MKDNRYIVRILTVLLLLLTAHLSPILAQTDTIRYVSTSFKIYSGIHVYGGGEIEFCFVHSCQSAGVGVVQGYGGGVCIDHGGSIGHSHITSCAARCGGGRHRDLEKNKKLN